MSQFNLYLEKVQENRKHQEIYNEGFKDFKEKASATASEIGSIVPLIPIVFLAALSLQPILDMSKPRGSDYLDEIRKEKELKLTDNQKKLLDEIMNSKGKLILTAKQEKLLNNIMNSKDIENDMINNKQELQEIIKNNEEKIDKVKSIPTLFSKIKNFFN